MATDVAPARRITRIKSLYGKIARFVDAGHAPSKIRRPERDQTVATRPDGRPAEPVVAVTTLENKPFVPPLAAIWGWAYSGDDSFPEGIVEAALDDEDRLGGALPPGADGGI